jgi:selenocysteine lyase/cysteine desulfurase
MLSDKSILELKIQFELDPDFVHFALAMIAPHPKCVRQAIEKHRAGFDSNPTLYFRKKDEYIENILRAAAQYLGCTPDSLCLTESTTMGLAVVLTGIKLKPGDEILSTVHEHYATRETLRFKSQREQVALKVIELYDQEPQAHPEAIVQKIVSSVTSNTRLVVLTWVHSCSGIKLPIRKITAALAQLNFTRTTERKILIALDAVHAFGVEYFNILDLGVDFFITGCHKWFFGPRGTGIVWGSKQGWKLIHPIQTSFDSQTFWAWYTQKTPEKEVSQARFATPGGFPAFEHRWALLEAFSFAQQIGPQQIQQHIEDLSGICIEKLSSLDNISIKSSALPELRSGVICFEVNGISSKDAVDQLIDKKVVCGQTPYHKSYVRFMTSILLNEKDVEFAVNAVKELA